MDYLALTRTNYFHVEDEDALKDLVKMTDFSLWEEPDDDGRPTFALGSTSGDVGSSIDWQAMADAHAELDEDEYETWFLDSLQRLVADGDVAVITTIGHEGMRYLSAYAVMLTRRAQRVIDLEHEVAKEIKGLVDVGELPQGFSTRMDY